MDFYLQAFITIFLSIPSTFRQTFYSMPFQVHSPAQLPHIIHHQLVITSFCIKNQDWLFHFLHLSYKSLHHSLSFLPIQDIKVLTDRLINKQECMPHLQGKISVSGRIFVSFLSLHIVFIFASLFCRRFELREVGLWGSMIRGFHRLHAGPG